MKPGADLRPPLRRPSGNSESATGAYFLSLVGNLIIGYLTLFPLVMLALVLENAYSFSPGWTGDFFGLDDDEVPLLFLSSLILLLPLVSAFLLGNILIHRRTTLSRLKYWSIAVAEFVLPLVISILISAL